MGFPEGPHLARETRFVGVPGKYNQEFRERAVRMFRDRLGEGEDSKRGARKHVGVPARFEPGNVAELDRGPGASRSCSVRGSAWLSRLRRQFERDVPDGWPGGCAVARSRAGCLCRGRVLSWPRWLASGVGCALRSSTVRGVGVVGEGVGWATRRIPGLCCFSVENDKLIWPHCDGLDSSERRNTGA